MSKYHMLIKPAITIDERHNLEKSLSALGYYVYGSGQMIDGSECDISFEDIPAPRDE